MAKRKVSSKKTASTVPCVAALPRQVQAILDENDRRNEAISTKFNPVTGEGSVGKRKEVTIKGFPYETMWLPLAMLKNPLVKKLIKAGSLKDFITRELKAEDTPRQREVVVDMFNRVRNRHDFPYWAATLVKIQSKTPGEGEILFRLTRPQRKFVERLEEKRLAGKPIRFILLKARQWGGSTTSQLYMAWLQLVHKVGLNSAIISQTKKTSFAIKDMFDRALKSYPVEMLHEPGEQFDPGEPKMTNVGLSGDFKRIPQRDCTITIASYEAPDAVRGGAYALVHCSEVGLWKPTDSKTPDDVVGSVSGIPTIPYTMIVYESTAKGSGNFFHREYQAAKDGKSQFDAVFVSWIDIDLYRLDFENGQERAEFAQHLYDNRSNAEVKSNREEPGTYLWRLWNMGATLEGLHWYVTERSGKDEHAVMASEYPSDDIEAFTFSGRKVFDDEDVERLKATCKPPRFKGDIYGARNEGEGCLDGLRIIKEQHGSLWVWDDVEPDDEQERVTDRYLVVVDVCKGLTAKADYSVITVFDRLWMIEGGNPTVVAQWRGHIEMDKLAWKAAQVAEYYNHALLVIESNTLETNNTRSEAEYILTLVRDVYDNLYARKTENANADVKEKPPVKYGFHTNVKTKGDIIVNLQTVVREGLYTERDERCLEEYMVYIQNEKGVFEAPAGFHDDILMTRAIGMWVCLFEMDRPRIRKRKQPQQGSDPVTAATI
jgi:hypothetical protein